MGAATSADDLAAAASKAFSMPFDGVIKLEPEGGSPLWIDGRAKPPAIGSAPPSGLDAGSAGQCIWRGARETMIRLLEGDRLLGSSYLSQRLAIAGDMAVMARLQLERPDRAQGIGRA